MATKWLEILLALSAVISLHGQSLKTIDDTTTAPTSNARATKKPQSFYDVAQQVLKAKEPLNDTIAKVAQQWKNMFIHGDTRVVPVLKKDQGISRLYLPIGLKNEMDCHLHPLPMYKNVTIYENVLELISSGRKLITFTVHFPEYEINPLTVNMSNNYKSDRWFRTYDTHAYTLLALPFNYKIISMYTLWFGTEELDVEVIDYPKGCFPRLDADDKLYVMMDLASKDFKLDHDGHKEMHGQDSHVCHQIIKVSEGQGQFSYRCCRRREEDGALECAPYDDSTWLKGLFIVLLVVDLLAFLFGPQFINHMIFGEELNVKPYEVELDPPIDGTMSVDYSSGINTGSGTLIEEPLKPMSNNHEAKISITKLLLKVDHRLLMSTHRVPVGFFKFINDNVFKCGMRRSEPFKSCFKSPICWYNGEQPRLKNKILNFLANIIYLPVWGDFMKLIGKTVMIFCLPIPLYIRLAIYYFYESDEIDARKEAIDGLGITMIGQYDLFYLLTPTHPFYQMVYGLIIASLICLIILRQINAVEFDDIIISAFKDLRRINRFETFRLLFTHLLLPFETCGICGIFFAPFYWVGMILVSVIIVIVYSIPTVYLVFRLLIPDRPEFIKQMHCKTFQFCWCPKSKMIEKLSRSPDWDGVCSSNVNEGDLNTTFEMNIAERRLFLHRISPDDTVQAVTNVEDLVDSEEQVGDRTYQVTMSDVNNRKKTDGIRRFFYRLFVGLCCVIFILCSLLLFCEVVGFFVEVAVFSFMGAIVNASSAGKFITVALTLLLYCVSIFRNFHGSYAKLNRNIFKLLTDKLDDKIKEVTDKPADQQADTAYRYLKDGEIAKLGGKKITNSFKQMRDHLIWKCKGLVLFVDAHDTPRIPKKFFHRACEITVSGCPGKVVINLLKTIRQVVFMVLFLGFVLWVVILFHSVYTLTTTQQLLFTLSGSFLPFLIRFLMQMKSSEELNFNNYAFQGCVNEILIRKYEQGWPVCGFEYIRRSDGDPSDDRISPSDDEGPVSTCDRGMQTEPEQHETKSSLPLLQNEPQNDLTKELKEFNCHIHMSPRVKKRRNMSQNKAKPHCYIDINIAQLDRQDKQPENLEVQLDVIGAEVNKIV